MQFTAAAFFGLVAVASAAAPYGTNGTVTSPVATDCVSSYNTCRQPTNGVSANQAYCASQNAACKGSCEDKYNTCRQPTNGMSANQAACAAQYAGCLGENPFASNGTNTVTSSSGSATAGPVVYTTEVVTAFTTYCPAATSVVVGGKTYTVTEATTLTITDCPCTISKPVQPVMATPTSIPGGCNPAHPGSCPSSYFNTTMLASVTKGPWTTTEVYAATTTYCPSSTQITVGTHVYTVSSASTVTIPAQTQTKTYGASTAVGTGSATKSGAASTSSMAVFEGAAGRTAAVGGVSSFFIAVASFFLF